MQQYLLLIYIEPALLQALPIEEFNALMRDCLAHADQLQAEGLAVDRLKYIHMRVGRTPRNEPFDARWQALYDEQGRLERMRVRRGMRIHVGDRLGSINNQAHVHLAVGTGGFETNAVALGFQNYADHFAPRITDVALLDDTDQPMAAGSDGVVMVARSQSSAPGPPLSSYSPAAARSETVTCLLYTSPSPRDS